MKDLKIPVCISLTQVEKDQMKQEGLLMGLNISQFIVGLFNAFKQAKKEKEKHETD